jgi:transcriptional regulator of NAD metabolism
LDLYNSIYDKHFYFITEKKIKLERLRIDELVFQLLDHLGAFCRLFNKHKIIGESDYLVNIKNVYRILSKADT